MNQQQIRTKYAMTVHIWEQILNKTEIVAQIFRQKLFSI